MNLKKVYLIIKADKFELPVACFDNLVKVSTFFNEPICNLKSRISRGHIQVHTKYQVVPTIIDIDDEEDDPKYVVTAKYKTGEFFGEYNTFETAKECAFKLSRMSCKVVDVRERQTNHLLLYIDNNIKFK